MAKSNDTQEVKELLDDELDQVNGGIGNRGTTFAAGNFQGAMNFQNSNNTNAAAGVRNANGGRLNNSSIFKGRSQLSGAETMSELNRNKAIRDTNTARNRFQGNNAGGNNNGGTRFDQNQ